MRKVFKFLVFLTLFALAGAAYIFYSSIFRDGLPIKTEVHHLYLPTGADFDEALDSLIKQKVLEDTMMIRWVASLKDVDKIHGGYYRLTPKTTLNELLNKLGGGLQTPVDVQFNNVRTLEQLAGKLAVQLEPDSMDFIAAFEDEELQQELGFEPETYKSMFLPNKYEFYWTTSAENFCRRMQKEYSKFWNAERLQKLEKTGLSKHKASILASIVQAEQAAIQSEKSTIAGLYINRLNKGMRLQSDPTLLYAMGDFSRKRLLNKDKEIESPYNTYKHGGLPPGPINLPEISSIDAVLDFEENDYLYMCAKEDFSGYHYFSKTLSQHNIYARRYQQALNQRGVKK